MAELQPKSLYERILEASTSSDIQEIKDFILLSKIRCHLPCKVLKVDYSSRTVEVQIQGKQDMGYGAYETFPILSDIPIIEPHCTSRAYIMTPLKAGDTGLLEFLDFNCSNFNQDGNIEPTLDPEFHSLNSSVFINGYIPQSNVFPNYTPNSKLNNVNANKGMIEAGNIDLYNRPQVKLEDGTTATVRSMTFEPSEGKYAGKQVLIPTISQDGRELTFDEAIRYFYKTGQHLGIFETPNDATEYAVLLHEDQDSYYSSIDCPITVGLNDQTFTLTVSSGGELNITSPFTINLNSPTVNTTGDLNVGNGVSTVVQAGNKILTFVNGVLYSVG